MLRRWRGGGCSVWGVSLSIVVFRATICDADLGDCLEPIAAAFTFACAASLLPDSSQ